MEAMKVYRRGMERSALVMRGSRTVAEVFTDQEPGDQYAAAELFAAAPALLAALQRAEQMLSDWQHTLNARGARVDPLLDEARAAIARAKGGV